MWWDDCAIVLGETVGDYSCVRRTFCMSFDPGCKNMSGIAAVTVVPSSQFDMS